MNIIDTELSRFTIYALLFLAVILFFVFRVINYFIKVIPIRKNVRKPIIKYLPVFELFVWLLFSIWAVKFFLQTHYLYSLGLLVIILIIILWISWFALKDIIAGIVFKTSEKFSVNESIKIKNYEGKIAKLKSRSLEIETETGETINIPYSIVISEIITKSNPAETILNYSFSLNISKKLPLYNTIENLKAEVLNLPWSSIKKEPVIKLTGENDSHFFLEITAYSLEKEYFSKIENYLKEKYSKA